MNRFLIGVLCLGIWGGVARAESAIGVGVAVGGIVATSPVDAAVNVDLGARLVFGERWIVGVRAGGWALPQEMGAQSELVFALSGGIRTALSEMWTFSVEAAPALVVVDSLTSPVRTDAGVWFSPLFEWQTRRRSLAVQAGARGLWFRSGWRVGPVVGFVYTFQN